MRVREPEELRTSTGYLLARVGMESRRAWARMLADHGLTPHHYGVMIALDQSGTTSQQRLSRLIGIDPRNAVPIIDLLEQRGLISRRVEAADRRRHAVCLTDAGRSELDELRLAGDRLESAFLGPLSPAERATLHSLLARLLPGGTEAPAPP